MLREGLIYLITEMTALFKRELALPYIIINVFVLRCRKNDNKKY